MSGLSAIALTDTAIIVTVLPGLSGVVYRIRRRVEELRPIPPPYRSATAIWRHGHPRPRTGIWLDVYLLPARVGRRIGYPPPIRRERRISRTGALHQGTFTAIRGCHIEC